MECVPFPFIWCNYRLSCLYQLTIWDATQMRVRAGLENAWLQCPLVAAGELSNLGEVLQGQQPWWKFLVIWTVLRRIWGVVVWMSKDRKQKLDKPAGGKGSSQVWGVQVQNVWAKFLFGVFHSVLARLRLSPCEGSERTGDRIMWWLVFIRWWTSPR